MKRKDYGAQRQSISGGGRRHEQRNIVTSSESLNQTFNRLSIHDGAVGEGHGRVRETPEADNQSGWASNHTAVGHSMVVEEDEEIFEGPEPHDRDDVIENNVEPNYVEDEQGAAGGREHGGSSMSVRGVSTGPRENILDEEMISGLGLGSEAILAIEGRLKLALTQARYKYAAEHDNDMEEAICEIRKKTDDTMAAMHSHWEDKHLRSADHWRDQITSLNTEMDQLNHRYQSSVVKQKELAL
jgi:hypothetical protein